jgi:hypothetical protein
MELEGQCAGGAGGVERDRGQHQPGGVRRELPRGQVGQRSGLEVGVDLLDDRVLPVGGLGLQHRLRGVGEHRVVAVGGEQLGLPSGTEAGFKRLTRRTFSRPVMWSVLRREVNAVKPISATSASETQDWPSSSQTACG